LGLVCISIHWGESHCKRICLVLGFTLWSSSYNVLLQCETHTKLMFIVGLILRFFDVGYAIFTYMIAYMLNNVLVDLLQNILVVLILYLMGIVFFIQFFLLCHILNTNGYFVISLFKRSYIIP
jgi:hypothetical protein